jgi:2-amino-4-hydroxy-6-hydroxymethyldihydropteridine diphosphokinase
MSEIIKMKHTGIIGIGSNINPAENIAKALMILREENEIAALSNLVQTAPIGIQDQPDFINGAAKVITDQNIEDFNNYLKGIEDRLKRDRTAHKYGPRLIDLDIVVWDGKIVDKDYYRRDFLKKAVDEIA